MLTHPLHGCCWVSTVLLDMFLQVKLLMVGSAGKLGAGVPLLAQLLDWIRSQGLMLPLPEDALGPQGSIQ